MTEAPAGELEPGRGADDVEARAAKRTGAERAAEHRPQLFAAHDRRVFPIERDEEGATRFVSLDDVDPLEARPDAGALVGVQRRDKTRRRRCESPP